MPNPNSQGLGEIGLGLSLRPTELGLGIDQGQGLGIGIGHWYWAKWDQGKIGLGIRIRVRHWDQAKWGRTQGRKFCLLQQIFTGHMPFLSPNQCYSNCCSTANHLNYKKRTHHVGTMPFQFLHLSQCYCQEIFSCTAERVDCRSVCQERQVNTDSHTLDSEQSEMNKYTANSNINDVRIAFVFKCNNKGTIFFRVTPRQVVPQR